MLKKLILTSAILAATSSIAMANPAPYVGAGLGINVNTSSNSFGYNFRGMPFNVLAGYGGVIDQNFYLAGELNATVGTAELSDHGLKSTYGYGASILPGVMLSDHTLAFVRAGIVRTRFTDYKAQTVTGGQLGLGLQTSLTQNVDVRGEYDFTAYNSLSRYYGTYKAHVSPRSDAFNLSLVYKFD